MNYQTLRYEVDNGLLLLTLNRPEQMNAFTVEIASELVHAYSHASVGDGKEGVRAFLEKSKPALMARASSMPPFYADWLGNRIGNPWGIGGYRDNHRKGTSFSTNSWEDKAGRQ